MRYESDCKEKNSKEKEVFSGGRVSPPILLNRFVRVRLKPHEDKLEKSVKEALVEVRGMRCSTCRERFTQAEDPHHHRVG